MPDAALAEYETLLSALASNIAAYAQAGGQVKQYKSYAFCQHQEVERRQLRDLLAEQMPVGPVLVTMRSSIWLRFHRLMTWFRLLGRTDERVFRDLRNEDILLLKLVAAFMDGNRIGVVCHGYLMALVRIVIEADNEIAAMLRRKPSLLGRWRATPPRPTLVSRDSSSAALIRRGGPMTDAFEATADQIRSPRPNEP